MSSAMWTLLLVFACSGVASTQDLDHRFFLMQIIEKYGENGSITYEGFVRLYKNLGLGEAPGNQTLRNESTVVYSNVTTQEKNNFDLGVAPGNQTLRNESTIVHSGVISQEKNHSRRTSRHVDPSFENDSSEEELASLVDQHDEVRVEVRPLNPPRCLAPAQLLAVYGLPRSEEGLSPVSFLHLCPAIIYQLDQRSCLWGRTPSVSVVDQYIVIPHSSWFFAILTISVISVSGLLCVAIVPLLQKAFISQLMSFLVALAVGTLLGDAFLHLIPHALEAHGGEGHQSHTMEAHESHDSHTDSVLKTGLMFLTVAFFFTFEAVLNVNRRNKAKNKMKDNANYMPVKLSLNHTEKETMEMSSNQLYDVTPVLPQVEGHSHSNTAVMVIMGDGLHNLTDGLAVGAAFSGGLAPGFATAVAVFTHELPHELGDFAVLLQSGVTVRKALVYNIVSSVLSLFGTVVGLVVGNFGDSTRWIYAITAGSFIYIALSNLVPEINRQKSTYRMIFLRIIGILCGGAIMGWIALYEQDIQKLFSQ